MEDKRLREEHVATFGDATLDRRGLGSSVSIRRCDLAARMCAERKLEATILGVGGVEVDARENHALHQLNRRLRVPDAGLFWSSL